MSNTLLNNETYIKHEVKVRKARQQVLPKTELKYQCSLDYSLTQVQVINVKCRGCSVLFLALTLQQARTTFSLRQVVVVGSQHASQR